MVAYAELLHAGGAGGLGHFPNGGLPVAPGAVVVIGKHIRSVEWCVAALGGNCDSLCTGKSALVEEPD